MGLVINAKKILLTIILNRSKSKKSGDAEIDHIISLLTGMIKPNKNGIEHKKINNFF